MMNLPAGGAEKRRKEDKPPGKEVGALSDEQIKELLELLRKALESEAVERITITIKPKPKPKQP